MRPFLNGRLPDINDVADILCGTSGWKERGADIREAVIRSSIGFTNMMESILTEKEKDEIAAQRNPDRPRQHKNLGRRVQRPGREQVYRTGN